MKKIILLIASCYAPILFANPITFENKIISEKNAQPKYVIQVNYPEIKAPDTDSEKKFNAKAKQWAFERIKEFKKTLGTWNTDNLSEKMKSYGSTLTINYDLNVLEPNAIIGLRYSTATYYVGAAHPSLVYSSMNYDLTQNKPLSLSSLFQPDSKYLLRISNTAREKIKTKLNKDGKAEIFEEGLAPTLKNYGVFTLTPEGLQITFNEYQVAAYVYGPQEVVIPYNQLRSLLVPSSPLARCLKADHCRIMSSTPHQEMPKTTF